MIKKIFQKLYVNSKKTKKHTPIISLYNMAYTMVDDLICVEIMS